MSIAPDGGVVEVTNGQPHMLYGVIVNHYAPFDGDEDRWSQSLQRNYAPFEDRNQPPRGFLEDATDDLVRTMVTSNKYLSAVSGSARAQTIDGARGYSVLLTGRSPLTGEDERVTVYTRALPDKHVIYVLCIAPSSSTSGMDRVCSRMIGTLAGERRSGASKVGVQRVQGCERVQGVPRVRCAPCSPSAPLHPRTLRLCTHRSRDSAAPSPR